MGESIGEPAEGAKEQSGSREQLYGQALGTEKMGDKRPTTAPMEALGDAPEDLLSKFRGEQLEKLKVEKAGLEKEQGKLLATQAKLMERRREDQIAFSRKDHILRELKANHDKLKGLLLPAMVRAETLHHENTLLKSEQGDDEDDVLMLPVEGQHLITSAIKAKLTTVWDDTMRKLAGEKWSDPNEQE
ncbi:hypothetical protein L7F22_016296 [Adiantum nelumboides]|nr:hypothetical protein [Adiantum nelumboides]